MTRRVFCVGCKYLKSDTKQIKRRNIIWCNHPNKDECNHCELYWPKEELEDK